MVVGRSIQMGTRGKPSGRTSGDNDVPNDHTSVFFTTSRAPSVSSTNTARRPRGFQPTEVRKTKPHIEKLDIPPSAEASPKAETARNAVISIVDETSPKVDIHKNNDASKASSFSKSESLTNALTSLASQPETDREIKAVTETSKENTAPAIAVTMPHKKAAAVDQSKKERGIEPTTTTAAGKSSPSASSSIQLITGDQSQPSRWSNVMASEPIPDARWDNTSYPIDKPYWERPESTAPDLRNLPRYKSPLMDTSGSSKPKDTAGSSKQKTAKALNASDSFNRQLANISTIVSSNKPQTDEHEESEITSQKKGAGTGKQNDAVTSELVESSPPPHLRGRSQTSRPGAGHVTTAESSSDHVAEKGKTPERNVKAEEKLDVRKGIAITEDEAKLASMVEELVVNNEQIAVEMQGAFSEEPKSALKANTMNKTQESQDNPVPPLPPHRRTQKSKTPALNTKVQTKPSMIKSSVTVDQIQQESTATTQSKPLKDITKTRQNVRMAVPTNGAAQSTGTESATRQGKKPANGLDPSNDPSRLRNWDGTFLPPPIGEDWMDRPQHDSRSSEKLNTVVQWTENRTMDSETEHLGNDEKPLDTIRTEHPETIPNPDDFTQAKRHLSALDAMEAFKAKRSASGNNHPSELEGMPKDQRREYRRLQRLLGTTQNLPPSRHAPAANIYLRPGEMKDMHQVMLIHNYYVVRTAMANELEANDEIYWRSRFQECHDEGDPFLVAVHKAQNAHTDNRGVHRRTSETIVGFAFAADYGVQTTGFRYTVELELWVHHDHLHQGIGRTMLDRMLAALDPGYNLLECVPLLGKYDATRWSGGGRRIVKTILVNLLHNDVSGKHLEWKKAWLAKNDFEHGGTLPGLAFKFGKPVNQCQMLYSTAASLPPSSPNDEDSQ